MLCKLLLVLTLFRATVNIQLIPNLLEPSIIYPYSVATELKTPKFCIPYLKNNANCSRTDICQSFKHQNKRYRVLGRFTKDFEENIPTICCHGSDDSKIGVAIDTAMAKAGLDLHLPRIQSRANGVINATLLTPQTSVVSNETLLESRQKLEAWRLFQYRANDSSLNESLQLTEDQVDLRQIGDMKSILPAECGISSVALRRIVGGQEAILGAWPWMAALYVTNFGIKNMECGAALITARHVITAAHCVVDPRRGVTLPPDVFSVRLGDHNIDSDEDGLNPIEVKVKSIRRHPNFVRTTFHSDIAILELGSVVEFGEYISPVCLPFGIFDNNDLSGRNAFVTGWGTLSFDGNSSSVLQEVQIRIQTNENCEAVFKDEVPISSSNLCAGDDGKDACRGDSGGPMMLPDKDSRFFLVGIVSFGKKCAEPGYPGVYTRVTSFLGFISDALISTS